MTVIVEPVPAPGAAVVTHREDYPAMTTPSTTPPTEAPKHAEAEPEAVELNSAADILAIDDLVIEAVTVKAWGNKIIHVKGLSGAARDSWIASVQEQSQPGGGKTGGPSNGTAKMLVRAICDADGKLLFTPQQANALGNKSSAGLEELSTVVLRLSGLTPEAEAAAEGNSDAEESSASTTN